MNKIIGKKQRDYPKKTFNHAATAIDVVLFRIHKNSLQVLLVKLKEDPFVGKWALPGGLVTHRETLEKAAARHLKDKIGLRSKIYLEQLYTFGDPKRDPLGWVVSVAYLGLSSRKDIDLKTDPRYDGYKWFSVSDLPELAYDHDVIVRTSVKRLVSKVGYTNIVRFLIKRQFTLTELQVIYELLLEKELDKRNFRKKVLGLNVLKPLNRYKKEGPQRPARLYSFVADELIEVQML